METKSTHKELWTCPKCGREFERKNQMHSCKIKAIEEHFEGKSRSMLLYQRLKEAFEVKVGAFKTESLDCCIHWVEVKTFLAVKVFEDKIQVHFSLNKKIENSRIVKCTQMSAYRYLHYVDIYKVEDIDEELIRWIYESYFL